MGRREVSSGAHMLLFVSCCAVLGCSGKDDESGVSGDGDGDQSEPTLCEDDDDCSDEVFCNGEERCNPDHEDADASGCLRAVGEPCSEGNTCNESNKECGCEDPDADGDGFDSTSCGGDDCDDDDSNRYPGNTETCDAEHHDEDCDPNTFGFRDQDGDDDPDDECCNEDESGDLICGTDCNDNRGNQHSFNTEICDDIDNDCDGLIDESLDGDEDDGLKTVFTIDADGDGWGSSEDDAETVLACDPPDGYVDTTDDCDDDDNQIHPSATEVCDYADNDCDGLEDEDDDEEDGLKIVFTIDADGDGFGSNAEDAETALACSVPNGYSTLATDCDDGAAEVNPLAVDSCNDDIDNDCSSVVNDPPGGCFCEGNVTQSCGLSALEGGLGLSGKCGTFNRQCNDGQWDDCPLLPGAENEVCDAVGVDENCDGHVNNSLGSDVHDSLKITFYRDRDGDDYPDLSTFAKYCPDLEPDGWITDENPNDCVDVALSSNPRAAAIHPGAVEVCNGVDDDCDGTADDVADLEASPSPPNTSALACGGNVGWTIAACSGDYLYCDSNLADSDGCETLGSTLDDCGACGNKCSFSCQDSGGLGCVELTALATGAEHTCGVLDDGRASCWGNGGSGRLGYGDTASVPAPEVVSLLSGVSAIAGGGTHTCAIDGSQDKLYCWGSNGNGQLGVGLPPGDLESSTQPLAVPGSSYEQVSLGDAHTCAIRDGGDVVCWGSQAHGRLANGGFDAGVNILSPVPAHAYDDGLAISDALMVAAGGSHTCYLSTDGFVSCAGRDHLGQLGTDSPDSASSEYFHQVAGLSSVTQLAAGTNHNCAVVAGEVWCWGSNSQGQLGQPVSATQATTPVKVAGLTGVTALAAGIAHTCALGSAGAVHCWGQGSKGQLGVNVDVSTSPVKAGERGAVDLLNACDVISAAGYHTCARETSSLQVKCWGADDSGQLADGVAGASEDNDPTAILPLY